MAELDLKLSDLFHLCEGKGKGACPVRFCRNSSRQHGRLCGTHHTTAWRKRNPVKAAWLNLRTHANRRKLAFDIPLEVFKELCERTGYLEGKGSRPESLAIDRIQNWKGYVMGNIRVVTVAVNGLKGYHEGKLKLSSGQEVMWEEIGIDQYIRQNEERVAAYNPWHPANSATGGESSPESEDLPEWILKDPSACKEAQCRSDDPF